MSRVFVLGPTGSLGRHVLGQAIGAGHSVTVIARTPAAIPAELADRIVIRSGDLGIVEAAELARSIAGHDVLINCAGNVADGERFVKLFDRVVASVETLAAPERPVCWLMAGAALLDVDALGRRALDFPQVKSTYWPHEVNFERLQRSSLDWRLLCPGPMVDEPAVGLERLRTSRDRLPVDLASFAKPLPPPQLLQAFASVVPEMIVPYADAAAFMLANLDRGSALAKHRIGLALPEGMRRHKAQWSPKPEQRGLRP